MLLISEKNHYHVAAVSATDLAHCHILFFFTFTSLQNEMD
jgi:hypothetical protein